ncbi:MAG TPA: hypothetical protein VF599_04125 [Pyrinomonadaceae bacterium]
METLKKGKRETKLKFVAHLISKILFPGEFFPGASLETTKTITADEFISTLRRGLYGEDLQTGISHGENESEKLLNE